MNQRQRQAVARKGFTDILDMTLDAIGSRSHLCWLMDKLDPKDMTIRPGPGKELKITKETVRLILGVPCAGGGKPLGIYYLDHLHAAAAPQNKFDTPRIKYFDRNIIKALTEADKRKSWQGGEPFGHCDFRSATDTCYASARENHGLRTSLGRVATRHEATPDCHGPSAPAPGSHAPQPSPSITKDCHADADDRRHCDLPALERPKFEAKLAAHDQAVEEQIATIKHCLTSIVDKQFDLKDTFYEMIDDVLRAEATNNDETPQPSNDHDHAAQEPCTDSGTQLTPETQLDTPAMGT
ncbi:hypothetical protein U9M48_035858 [Paspalum notatum var. saurae]|uniref:Uncharacterized protein n=1 Tax=Paspalum notatum var. saurae TaxID=547442 RepID=A0AAQ3X808_PASNO